MLFNADRTKWACRVIWIAALAIGCAASAGAELPTVDGIIGLSAPEEGAWFTVKVPVPEGLAISGIAWYNNDEYVVYPQVRAGTGYDRGPGDVQDMIVLVENASGESSGWSELEFAEPLVASCGSLYIAFEVLPESSYIGEGEGGGPGMGYCDSSMGSLGWMSEDGLTWIRLHYGAHFAFLPQYVEATADMAVKSLSRETEEGSGPPVDPFMTLGPNPFNPKTTIVFGLPRSTHVTLEVFDIRGRRVATILDEPMSAGEHRASWVGKDDVGRSVASGVYFARLRYPGEQMIKKMTVIK